MTLTRQQQVASVSVRSLCSKLKGSLGELSLTLFASLVVVTHTQSMICWRARTKAHQIVRRLECLAVLLLLTHTVNLKSRLNDSCVRKKSRKQSEIRALDLSKKSSKLCVLLKLLLLLMQSHTNEAPLIGRYFCVCLALQPAN